jgi:hypothetical protein
MRLEEPPGGKVLKLPITFHATSGVTRMICCRRSPFGNVARVADHVTPKFGDRKTVEPWSVFAQAGAVIALAAYFVAWVGGIVSGVGQALNNQA